MRLEHGEGDEQCSRTVRVEAPRGRKSGPSRRVIPAPWEAKK